MSKKLNLNKKPEYLLLVASLVFFLSSAFFLTAEIDFQKIKMFSVPIKTMFWIIPFYHSFLWLLYLLTKKFLYSITMTWIHVLATVFTTVLIIIILFSSINPSRITNDRYELIGNATQSLFLIFVFAQLIFVANILLGALSTKRFVQEN